MIFAADSANSIVYSTNVETGEVREAYIGDKIGRMAYLDNELFVTVLTDSQSLYWLQEGPNGMIAVIDTKTMELKEKIDIAIRPFNIFAGRNSYLYVTSR